MRMIDFARELCTDLRVFPEVQHCNLYGSISHGNFDEYSDVDVEVDVSGHDNGQFLLRLPALLARRYNVIFYDFAPSLAPEKYVVTVAVQTENPFATVDVACVATPHCRSITPQELSARNNRYDHVLKLFSANLKHHLRQADCHADITRMYRRVAGITDSTPDDRQMLKDVYMWLQTHATENHMELLDAYRPYVARV